MTTDRVNVAIRILKAVCTRQDPDEKDIELLRAYYPDYTSLGPDDLARVAIRDSIKNRSGVKTMRAGSDRPPV